MISRDTISKMGEYAEDIDAYDQLKKDLREILFSFLSRQNDTAHFLLTGQFLRFISRNPAIWTGFLREVFKDLQSKDHPKQDFPEFRL